jgi:hypothetical protein
MNKCNFTDFMQSLKPWLNNDYIHQARLGAEGTFTLWFVDGGYQTYQIDDCTSEQLENTIEHLKKHGVQVIR